MKTKQKVKRYSKPVFCSLLIVLLLGLSLLGMKVRAEDTLEDETLKAIVTEVEKQIEDYPPSESQIETMITDTAEGMELELSDEQIENIEGKIAEHDKVEEVIIKVERFFKNAVERVSSWFKTINESIRKL